MNRAIRTLSGQPALWSFAGAAFAFAGALASSGGHGLGGMLVAALSLATFLALVGLGQMFVITLGPGNVDLSLPANIGLASAIAMKVMDGSDAMAPLGIAAALGAGALIGLANYALIAALRIPPIIATLSASFIVQSIDISYGRGLQIKPPPMLADLSASAVLGVPVLFLFGLALTLAFGVVLHRLVFGRFVAAIGQNGRAAWLAGIPVERIRCATYVLCGALGGLAGVLLAAYFRGASIDIGNEYLLGSIAVVVIGGTAVSGGRATVAGLWGGGLFLVSLQIMLNTFGAPAGWRFLVTGLVILAVIAVAGGGTAARR